MLLPDKKKAVGMIVSRLSKDGRDLPPEPEGDEGMRAIAQDLIDAVKEGNADMVAKAMQAWHSSLGLDKE